MTDSGASIRGYQLRVLLILALINFVNFADRTVILPLFPLLQDYFQVSNTKLGALQTVLQAVLSLATVPFALLADRVSRRRIIAAGVIFWSLATFLSGIAATFAMLLVARALVGVGEAAYAPAAQSVISGAFSAQARAKAQAVFAAGMLIGGTAGLALGSVLGTDYGWRSAFYFVGVPGLILGLTVLRLEEPPRPPREDVVPLMQILRVPAFAAMCLSGTLITFGSISFITWGAKFAEAEKGYSLKEAGVWLGGTLLVAALLGVLAGGAVADYLQRRLIYGRVLTVALAFLAAAPFVLWAIQEERRGWALGSFFIAAFLMSWYHGPVTAILHDLMPARAHATSVGVYNLVTQFLGGTLAPVAVGRISDLYGLERGLQLAVAVMTLGGLSFLFVIHLIRRHGLQPAPPA